MRNTIMLLFAIASPACRAEAQVSSNELFASYCFGVFEQRVREGRASKLGKDVARQEAQTLGRLYAYLKVKMGANHSRSDLRQLLVAKENGVSDLSECMSAIETDFTREACIRTTQWCRPTPDPVATPEAPQRPGPVASPPQQRPVPNTMSSQSSLRQNATSVPAPSRPEARALTSPPPAPQAALPDARTKSASQCTVSRPKPGFKVYLVTCPNSQVTIGRTVDMPTGWTVGEGTNPTEAIEFFMKSAYAR